MKATVSIQNALERNAPRETNRPKRTLNLVEIEDRTELTYVRNLISKGEINNAAKSMENLIQKAQITLRNNKRKAKPWFDRECYEMRRTTLTLLHQVKLSNTPGRLMEYAQARKKYKALIRKKKVAHVEEEANKMALAATKDPYVALRAQAPTFPHSIQMETWWQHFNSILNQRNRECAYKEAGGLVRDFTSCSEKEVGEVITHLKKHKASGPDLVYNEHIQESKDILLSTWTALFNECLRSGRIPDRWRESSLKILYKGKGNTDSTDSYRGIALESTIFKTFTKLITQRLTRILDKEIPDFQFGFREGRSTTHAIQNLINSIEDATRSPKGKLYAIFIDYRKAFDLLNRSKIITKVENYIGEEHYLTVIIREILYKNYITIDDGKTLSNRVTQTNGVLQGDCLSPLLFNIATADIGKILAGYEEHIDLYAYADDMVIASKDINKLQECITRLSTWAIENELAINKEKTVMMVFRNGGKVSKQEFITLETERINIVSSFKYLGITLQSSGKSYSKHVKEKALAAAKATRKIQNLTSLSIESAMKIFNTAIVPILTYGIELVWNHLKKKDLEIWESVKATFLKKALRVSKFTQTRLIYVLTGELTLIEELRLKLLLPSTEGYIQMIEARKEKEKAIWEDFYCTGAMMDKNWMGPNQELRHVITRLAVHGFHHKVCKNERFHTPKE